MTIYLYHKRHRDTGLNYFGKTKQDPYKYIGSGRYWARHLKKHGRNVETINVWAFDDLSECSKFALEFSEKNNITESPDWANLCPENGIDGGDKFAHMDESRLHEVHQKRVAGALETWKHRSRDEQASRTKNQWNEYSDSQKASVINKISQSLKNKTEEEKKRTLEKKRATEALRTEEEKKLSLEKRRATESLKPQLICPHCGLSSKNKANMLRYHFDMCKHINTGDS